MWHLLVVNCQINDKEKLRTIQNRVANLPEIYTDDEIVYNEQTIANVVGRDEAARDTYVESFAAMARKGFVSFDRTVIGNTDINNYHWVCRPRFLEREPANLNLVTLNERLLTIVTENGPVDLIDGQRLLPQVINDDDV